MNKLKHYSINRFVDCSIAKLALFALGIAAFALGAQAQAEEADAPIIRVSVNATSVTNGYGTGWTFANNVLALSEAMEYTISGTDETGTMRIEVTANADVEFNNLTLPLTNLKGYCIDFKEGTTNTLNLVGDNMVYGKETLAAVLVRSGAVVTLSGTGALVGTHANSRGFQIEDGGTVIMNGGTICDYSISNGGGGVFCRGGGAFTMNGGTIRNCTASSEGGGVLNNYKFTMNGGTISGCSAGGKGGAISGIGTQTIYGGTISGCSANVGGALYNDGAANIYGGTFTGNKASGSGGFCYCDNNNFAFIYGGYFAGNTAPAGNGNLLYAYDLQQNGKLYGGVFAANPTAESESCGCLVLQSLAQGDAAVTKVGNYYVVGTGVKSQNGKLTTGAYSFYPGNLEYEDAGLAVLDCCTVTEQAGTPRTWVVTPPDDTFRVNGEAVCTGSGEGWKFANDVLTLSKTMDYVLSGSCNESYTVDVTANANITLSDVRIHAGNLEPSAVFNITGADVTLILGGSNEVYSSSEYYRSAFGIASGAKLTMKGEGALYGGRTNGGSGSCMDVASGGKFIFDSGSICDYEIAAVENSGYFEMNGGVVKNCYSQHYGALLWNTSGTAVINGGSVCGCTSGNVAYIWVNNGSCEIYGGYFGYSDCNKQFGTNGGTVTVYGAVVDKANISVQGYRPEDFKAEGMDCVTVGDNKVIGQGVTETDGQLTGGIYTFDPQKDEYAAAGLTCASQYAVVPQGADPVTYKVRSEAAFKVNGDEISAGTGTGWKFADNVLTLSKPMDYTLTGYTNLAFTVDVLSNATVTLNGVRIKADKPERDIFRVFGDDTTFVLSGTNTVYATDGNAAIGVTAGAKLTVDGEGELVGGKSSGANGRGFSVYGELVLESGTIRDYYTVEPERGAGVYVAATGIFTLNGGSITNNVSSGFGGGICNWGSLTMNGGAISGNVARHNDGGAIWNGGTAVVNGGAISHNTANYFGGAVLNDGGTFALNGGELTGNAIVTHDTYWYGGTVFGVYDGDVIVNGGWIHDNNTSDEYAISVHRDSATDYAAAKVYGGVFQEKKYFRRYSSGDTLQIFGCECSSDPGDDYRAPGYIVESIGKAKSGWYVFVKNTTADICNKDGLTAGTYTFDPADDLYAEVGVTVAPQRIVTAQAATWLDPETYVVGWNNTGFTVNGTDAVEGIEAGKGWSFDPATGIVVLDTNRGDDDPYVLSGQNTREDIDLHVAVTNATYVTLSDATITTTTNAALAINAANVTLLLEGTNTLTSTESDALTCSADKSVMIYCADDYTADSAKLIASSIDGEGSVKLGDEYDDECATVEVTGDIAVGNLTIGHDGVLTVAGGINATTSILILGSRTTVAGKSGIVGGSVKIGGDGESWNGGTVVADTIKADDSVIINGGSVKAACTPNPKNGDGDTVWCVTFPDVTEYQVTEWYLGDYSSYGTANIYSIGGELYAWMPSREDTYAEMCVNNHIEPDEYYYADVNGAPTVAYHKHDELALYVNGDQVTTSGGTGWTYAQPDDPYPYDWVLTLSPSDETTNAYVITGEEMEGRVRIVVAGDCDVAFTGKLGAGDPEDYKEDHLITVNSEVAVNMTFSDTTAFKPYDDYAPVCVKSGATLNILGSGLVYNFNVATEGTGKVVMEDPTTLTYTTQQSAIDAAKTIKPRANEENFPNIDQDAYASRVAAVAVESSTPGMWTLDYEINEKGTNDIVMVISSVETTSNLVENITLGTPTATFYPVPGFYYGLPGATEVEDVEGATPPTWYRGQQDQKLTVEGPTFTDADKAFYQLRATLRP